jgi:hypothetical protein
MEVYLQNLSFGEFLKSLKSEKITANEGLNLPFKRNLPYILYKNVNALTIRQCISF